MDISRTILAEIARKEAYVDICPETPNYLCTTCETTYGTLRMSVQEKYIIATNEDYYGYYTGEKLPLNYPKEFFHQLIPFDVKIFCKKTNNQYIMDNSFPMFFSADIAIMTPKDGQIIKGVLTTEINKWIIENTQLIEDCRKLGLQTNIEWCEKTLNDEVIIFGGKAQKICVEAYTSRLNKYKQLLEEYNNGIYDNTTNIR